MKLLKTAQLFCACLFMLYTGAVAQPDTSTTEKLLHYVMQPLNKSQIPTGFLEEWGVPIVPMATFNGTLTDSNRIDMHLWRTLYFQLQTAYCVGGTNPLPAITSANSTIKLYSHDTLPVPIPLLIGQYSTVKSYAFSNNLLSHSSSTNQVADVPGRPESPYQVQNLLAACPSHPFTNTGTRSFVVQPGMIWNTTGKTISSIQVDFDNALGFQSISIGTPITVSYIDTGMKRWTIKLTFTDNSVLQCYNQYRVFKAAASNTAARYNPAAADNFQPFFPTANHDGGWVTIHYSRRNPSFTIRKPLLVVEGYDVNDIAPNLTGGNYGVNNFINDIDAPVGYNFNDNLDDQAGYDLVFVDFNRGSGDIRRNAALVEDIITWLNGVKVPDDRNGNTIQQNVVLGQSMGGLIARYALARMTKNNVATGTRLLITHDSPHQGANVPLGLQYLIRMAGNVELFGLNVRNIYPDYDEAISLLDDDPIPGRQTATQQLLLYRSTGTNSFVNNTFLGGDYRNMITFSPSDPQPTYRFIATSLGSECAHPLFQPYSKFLNIDADAFLFYFPILSYRLRTVVEAFALPNTGSTSKIARLKLSSKLKLFGFINISRDFYDNTAYAPGTQLPVDGASGSRNPFRQLNFDIPNISAGFPLIGLFGVIGYAYANISGDPANFTFVPTPSALDAAPFNSTSLSEKFVNGTNQNYPSASETFIAQETTSALSNNDHVQFTARNSEWLFREMENMNNTLGCSNECFNPYYISGKDQLCTSENYIIPGLPRGASVTWSVSPSYLATLSCSTCLSPTLTKVYDGEIVLTATISNACGSGSIQVNKTLIVGTPIVNMVSFYNSEVNREGAWCSTHAGNVFTIEPILSNVSYEARLLNWPSLTVFRTAPGPFSGGPVQDLFSYVPSGWYVLEIRATNACGTSAWYGYEVELLDCFVGRSASNFTVVASPNPTHGDLVVTTKDESSEVEKISKNEKVQYQLYNFSRTAIVKAWTYDNSQKQRTLNVRGLKPGQYILTVSKGKYRESVQILID